MTNHSIYNNKGDNHASSAKIHCIYCKYVVLPGNNIVIVVIYPKF